MMTYPVLGVADLDGVLSSHLRDDSHRGVDDVKDA